MPSSSSSSSSSLRSIGVARFDPVHRIVNHRALRGRVCMCMCARWDGSLRRARVQSLLYSRLLDPRGFFFPPSLPSTHRSNSRATPGSAGYNVSHRPDRFSFRFFFVVRPRKRVDRPYQSRSASTDGIDSIFTAGNFYRPGSPRWSTRCVTPRSRTPRGKGRD